MGASPANAKTPLFEAEFTGTLQGSSGDGHRVVFIATEPCEPDRLERIKTVGMVFLGPGAKNGTFGAETSAHEGSTFYLCAFALDAEDRLVSFGQYPKNPIIVRASDDSEIEFKGVDVVLAPVAPRQLPEGRYRAHGHESQ